MSDWSDLTFDHQDINYIYQLDTLRDRSEAVATEVEDARLGEASLDIIVGNLDTEITAAREGEVSLVANLQNNYAAKTGVNLDLQGQKIINVGDAVDTTDLINLQQAVSILYSGLLPVDLEITDLGSGTATEGQRLVVGSSAKPVGEDNEVLTLGSTGLALNEVVGQGASSLEAKNLTNISIGSLTPNSIVKTKDDGLGLEDYDSDLEDAMSAIYFYEY